MLEKRWVRTCVVKRGKIWSTEPVPMFGTNDEPGGEASFHSPDVYKMVARVLKRWREHWPIMVTVSAKMLKRCLEKFTLLWSISEFLSLDYLYLSDSNCVFRFLLKSELTDGTTAVEKNMFSNSLFDKSAGAIFNSCATGEFKKTHITVSYECCFFRQSLFEHREKGFLLVRNNWNIRCQSVRL